MRNRNRNLEIIWHEIHFNPKATCTLHISIKNTHYLNLWLNIKTSSLHIQMNLHELSEHRFVWDGAVVQSLVELPTQETPPLAWEGLLHCRVWMPSVHWLQSDQPPFTTADEINKLLTMKFAKFSYSYVSRFNLSFYSVSGKRRIKGRGPCTVKSIIECDNDYWRS